MEPVGSYSVFGYFSGDPDGERDERRRGLNASRLGLLSQWIAHHRFDGVLIEYHPEEPPRTAELFAHHLCSDCRCPGGCNYE